MKKYFLLSFLVLIVIPSTTFASWWNPFTWNTFNKTDNKTQVLENRIKELENKLNTVTVATTSTFKNTQSTTTKKETLVKNKIATTPIVVKSPNAKVDPAEFCSKWGTNHVWNGTPFGQAGKAICDCKTGYQENEKYECVPIVVTNVQVSQQKNQEVNPDAEWYKPDGSRYTAQEVANNRIARAPEDKKKCAIQNKVWDRTIINGEPNCITYAQHEQFCIDKYPNTTSVAGSNGDRLCGCKAGYVWNSGQTACEIQQQNNSFDSDPYGYYKNSGVVYSPEERNAIECAYYGTSCPTLRIIIKK